jgi:putative FmdB family regulatory protein
MPLYDLHCNKCGGSIERVLGIDDTLPVCAECGQPLVKGAGSFAMVRINGLGYPSRRKWMDRWSPQSPQFSTGSLHGERY